MRHQQLLACLGVSLALGVVVAAADQGGIIRRDEPARPTPEVDSTSVTYAGEWRPAGATAVARVVGRVIDITQVPVPKVHLQLRNLDTGSVERKLESNDVGEYEFEVDNTGTYVVEAVEVDGLVLALSNAGPLYRYDTFETVVQLPGRWDFTRRAVVVDQSLLEFFGMSARTSMTATTIQIAVEQKVTPADPGVPVSPSTPSS